jgi:hypothetical protein
VLTPSLFGVVLFPKFLGCEFVIVLAEDIAGSGERHENLFKGRNRSDDRSACSCDVSNSANAVKAEVGDLGRGKGKGNVAGTQSEHLVIFNRPADDLAQRKTGI